MSKKYPKISTPYFIVFEDETIETLVFTAGHPSHCLKKARDYGKQLVTNQRFIICTLDKKVIYRRDTVDKYDKDRYLYKTNAHLVFEGAPERVHAGNAAYYKHLSPEGKKLAVQARKENKKALAKKAKVYRKRADSYYKAKQRANRKAGEVKDVV